MDRELDRVEALVLAARFQLAAEPARYARDRAAELGHAPTLARAELLLGRIEVQVDDFKAARRAYEGAIQASAAASDPRGEAVAELYLMGLLADELTDVPAALRHARNVEALLQRLGDPPDLRARLIAKVGGAHHSAGDLDAAEEALRRALAISGDSEALRSARSSARSTLAVVLARRGKYEDSNELVLAQLEDNKARLGDSHPNVANALKNYGANLLHLGDAEGARVALEESAKIYRASVGHAHSQLATTLHNLALVHNALGQTDEAFEIFEGALAMKRETLGDHPGTAMLASDYGTLLFIHERRDDAVPVLEDAVRMFAATQGPNAPPTSPTR